MQIQKVNNQQNFGRGRAIHNILIRTRDPEILGKLAAASDLGQLRKINSGCKYTPLAGGVDGKGFYIGHLADGAEGETMLRIYQAELCREQPLSAMAAAIAFEKKADIVRRAKVRKIRTWEELLQLPMLKGLKEVEGRVFI